MVNGIAETVSRSRRRLDRRRPLRYQELRDAKKPDRREDVAVDLTGGSPEMDYAQAEQTYNLFLRLTKIMIVFLVLLLAGMGYFLT
jgi:hypothetical protein